MIQGTAAWGLTVRERPLSFGKTALSGMSYLDSPLPFMPQDDQKPFLAPFLKGLLPAECQVIPGKELAAN